ncbi:MAG: hypothetical protein IJE01_05450 [Clostridia bacterium]|nr:hypothetical protein [Clostridia bacterium]
MFSKLFALSHMSPSVGDAGISPLVVVLFIVCLIIVIGALLWTFFIGKKSHTDTTVITITDEDEISPTNTTLVEDIDAQSTNTEE